MNKILLGAFSLAVAVSLNAAVYATVNGKNITEAELAPLLAGMPGINIEQLPAEQKRQLVDKGIELQLLIDKAKKEGIMNDPLYKRELEVAKDALALRVWQSKQFQNVKVTDKEISDFYNKNKTKFVQPEQIQARHILVKTEKEAKDIISDLKNLKDTELNKKFTEVAKSKSIEPGAKETGGELGWFNAGQMVKPFSDAAFALKKGEISVTPVKTQFGYHVIYKQNQEASRQVPLDETKPYIEGILKQDKFKIQVQKEAEDLRKKAKVVYK